MVTRVMAAVAVAAVAAGCSSSSAGAPRSVPFDLPTSPSADVVAADRVQACEQVHGLSSSVDAVNGTDDQGRPTQTISFCAWPPDPGEDADGFARITATHLPGPGSSEATDATQLDVVAGTCVTFRLQYRRAIQGDDSPLDAFEATPSAAVDIEGHTWAGVPLGFYPPSNSVVVVHNDHVELIAASCT